MASGLPLFVPTHHVPFQSAVGTEVFCSRLSGECATPSSANRGTRDGLKLSPSAQQDVYKLLQADPNFANWYRKTCIAAGVKPTDLGLKEG